MTEETPRKSYPELACDMFNTCYFYDYRIINHGYLNILLQNVEKMSPDLKREQYKAIKTMLKAQQVTNAVFYCEDLALVLKSFEKEPKKYLTNIARVPQSEVKKFWTEIKDQDEEYFKKLIGLDKIKMTADEEKQCIEKIPELKRDLTLIGGYFNQLFGFSTTYKHGLLLFPGVNKENKNNVIVELDRNNLFNIVNMDAVQINKNTEAVVGIVNVIFNTIVHSLVTNLVLEPEEQKRKSFKKTTKADRPIEGDINISLEIFTFRKFSGKQVLPIYKSPLTNIIVHK